MVLRNADPSRAVFDRFFDFQDDDAIPSPADFRIAAPLDDGLYGLDGLFIHTHFMMLITSVATCAIFRIALLSRRYSAPFSVIRACSMSTI